MGSTMRLCLCRAALLVAFLPVSGSIGLSQESSPVVNPTTMPVLGKVDTRFQAYNVEMVEVTGGRFWKPYKAIQAGSAATKEARGSASTPAGMSADLYQYRPTINLGNPRLRKLAAALGPAYVRVSGTWANTTYFSNAEGPAPAAPPKGFNSVLTREQWKGVIDFAHAVHGDIVTSFAAGAGVRDAQGVWTPDQAGEFLSFTKSNGGKIAAAEFINETNLSP